MERYAQRTVELTLVDDRPPGCARRDDPTGTRRVEIRHGCGAWTARDRYCSTCGLPLGPVTTTRKAAPP